MKTLLLLCFILLFSFRGDIQDERTKNFPRSTEFVRDMPPKQKVWVFLMAGQSNMAGRGQVEPADTLVNKRILSINASNQLIYAKEPLHFYEPTRAGLDCGVSFAQTLLPNIPSDVSILIIPTAIGGSSISQWLGDSSYRGVKLLSNFREKLLFGKEHGEIKAILWHQGESDAKKELIPLYQKRLDELFTLFRTTAGDTQLPVLMGELGSYSNDPVNWQSINKVLQDYAANNKCSAVITTADLVHRGDTVHFNSEGQRMMGMRFGRTYMERFAK
jgi:hypothetical protein